LAESGYAGEPVTLMAAQDQAHHKAWGDVTADLLKRLGMKVDFVATDSGTVVARGLQKSPPGQGGWHISLSWSAGAVCTNPGTNGRLRANGDNNTFSGWSNIPQVEAEIAAWFDAETLDEEKTVARRLNKVALDHVVYAPLGFFLRYQAWRKNVTGIVKGPLPFFWGGEQDRLTNAEKAVAGAGRPFVQRESPLLAHLGPGPSGAMSAAGES
jgi:peptide/nickel transport system substrate-binding protein